MDRAMMTEGEAWEALLAWRAEDPTAARDFAVECAFERAGEGRLLRLTIRGNHAEFLGPDLVTILSRLIAEDPEVFSVVKISPRDRQRLY